MGYRQKSSTVPKLNYVPLFNGSAKDVGISLIQAKSCCSFPSLRVEYSFRFEIGQFKENTLLSDIMVSVLLVTAVFTLLFNVFSHQVCWRTLTVLILFLKKMLIGCM